MNNKNNIKQTWEDLYQKTEAILLEYGLTKDQALEVFYTQVQEYENRLQHLKLPGVKNEDKLEFIKKEIPHPFTDESFLQKIRKYIGNE